MGEESAPHARSRATVEEARALAHPLRLRILRLCGQLELTNKQLADRLGRDPGTVYYHVRLLARAGFLEQVAVRGGASGALEKPYRSTGRSWWLDSPLSEVGGDPVAAPLQAFQEELREAGPGSVETFSRFMLHLSREDASVLADRILAILDEYIRTDGDRLDQPAHGGMVILHRLAP